MSNLDDFKAELEKLVKKEPSVEEELKHKTHGKPEETTKDKLLVPLLNALGYDEDHRISEASRCHTECCVGMCPIVKRLFLPRYAHRISSPLGYAMSILFVFTSLLSARILYKDTDVSLGRSVFSASVLSSTEENTMDRWHLAGSHPST
jgi:hypothetical protein